MAIHSTNIFLSWSRRIALGLFVTLLALLGLGAGYEFMASTYARYAYPPPGRMIEIDDYRLHLDCRDRGAPTIILEAGGSQGSISWGLVQGPLSKHTRVCSYDRAAMGWSDPAPHPQFARDVVHDLHTLLDKADVHGPLILVGHSIGGIYVRAYTAQYPQRVQALLLIDSVHEDGLSNLWKSQPKLARKMQDNQQGVERIIPLIDWLTPLGIPRLFYRDGVDVYPDRLRGGYAATYFRPQRLKASLAEITQLNAKLAQVKSKLSSLGARPLIVMTAGRYLKVPGLTEDESRLVYDNHWQMQAKLLALSSHSQQIVVRHSGHNIHLEQPRVVIKAIRTLIDNKVHP
ncbi:MAG: alpha/beta hydrolase [Gammaproteobacteria bacterium]|nr:alpha/beta hydrolase [Gammaproteobacteria bacterium]